MLKLTVNLLVITIVFRYNKYVNCITSNRNVVISSRADGNVIFEKQEQKNSNTTNSGNIVFERPAPSTCNYKCLPLTDCPKVRDDFKIKGIPVNICYYNNLEAYVCCPTTEEKEKQCPSPLLNFRVSDGIKANPHDFQYMVALAWKTLTGNHFGCGGTLVDSEYIVTAAHCLYLDGNYTPLQFALIGGGSINNGNKLISIERTFVHPDYKKEKKYHDIAVLKLAEKSSYQAACLPGPNLILRNGTKVIGAGYGQTSYYGKTSENLIKANFSIFASSDCSKYYGNLIESQICAIGQPVYFPKINSTSNSDTCQGDSGGPLILETPGYLPTVVGVISFGYPCGSAVPGIYTNVSSYLEWILRIINNY